jgi:hypothetical protein
MIKKYNQFLNENQDFEEPSFEENELEKDFSEEDEFTEEDEFPEEEEEEEGADVYKQKLKDLADKLGVEIQNNKIEYEGKIIIFPSETEKFHVDKKKFNTIEEVLNYLKK